MERQAGDAGHGSPGGGAGIQEVRQGSAPSGIWVFGLRAHAVFFFFLKR